MNIDSVSGSASAPVSAERNSEANKERKVEEDNNNSEQQQTAKEASLEENENQKTLAKA